MVGVQKIGDKWWATKVPKARKDYIFDWTKWLDGDTIQTPDVVVAGGGTGVEACSLDGTSVIAGSKVLAWVKGGTSKTEAAVACKIATVGGRIDEVTLMLKIE